MVNSVLDFELLLLHSCPDPQYMGSLTFLTVMLVSPEKAGMYHTAMVSC